MNTRSSNSSGWCIRLKRVHPVVETTYKSMSSYCDTQAEQEQPSQASRNVGNRDKKHGCLHQTHDGRSLILRIPLDPLSDKMMYFHFAPKLGPRRKVLIELLPLAPGFLDLQDG